MDIVNALIIIGFIFLVEYLINWDWSDFITIERMDEHERSEYKEEESDEDK